MTLHDNVPDEHEEVRRAARVPRGYIVTLVTLAILTAIVGTFNIALSRRAAAPAGPTSDGHRLAQSRVAPKPAEAPPAKSAPVVAKSESPVAATKPESAPVVAKSESPVVATKPAPAPAAAKSEDDGERWTAPRVTAPGQPEVAAMAKTVELARPAAEPPAPSRAETNGQPPSQPVTEAPVMAPTARVAQWMADTYGKAEAERRIKDVMAIYPAGDDRLVHWRKVLGHLHAMAER